MPLSDIWKTCKHSETTIGVSKTCQNIQRATVVFKLKERWNQLCSFDKRGTKHPANTSGRLVKHPELFIGASNI